MNIRNQNAALKNLETQVEQLTKDFQEKAAKEAPNSSTQLVIVKKFMLTMMLRMLKPVLMKLTNSMEYLLFLIVICTPPCMIGSLNMCALEDLGASVNIMPYSMFKNLELTNLKKTTMLVEMADMSKKALVEIVENVLVKIDKFVFPYDFVVIDMLGDPNETMILGRPFLATIHARTNIFHGEILLGICEDRVLFDMNGNVHHLTKKVCMANSIQEEESFNPLEIGEDLFLYDSPFCLEFKKYNHMYDDNESNKDTFVCDDNVQEPLTRRKGRTKMTEPGTITWKLHSCKLIRVIGNDTCRFWPTCDPNSKDCNKGDSIYGRDEHGVLKQWYCYCDNERRDVTTAKGKRNGIASAHGYMNGIAAVYNYGVANLHGLKICYDSLNYGVAHHCSYAVCSLETLTRLHSSTRDTEWFKRLVAYAKYNRDSYEIDSWIKKFAHGSHGWTRSKNVYLRSYRAKLRGVFPF
ncbi:reverse transcriptase domain-containing protein [Tanacetum coccineum]|uniref:Reverse transcriptase domain-containing protein n=1 Tax=Tanacetum coccineum TaxID=301880 RepID=A0ABQ4WFU9_9ASTR